MSHLISIRVSVDTLDSIGEKYPSNVPGSKILTDIYKYKFVYAPDLNIIDSMGYEVELTDEKEETFFLLKTGFKKIENKQ